MLSLTLLHSWYSSSSLLCPLPPSVRSYKSVIVLCCCITNESKTEWLKTTHIAYLSFCGSGSQVQLNRGLSFGGLSQANITVLDGAPLLPSRVQSAFKLTQGVLAGGSAHGWVYGGLQSSLVNHWRQPLVPCRVSLSMGSFIRAGKRARARPKSQSFVSQS